MSLRLRLLHSSHRMAAILEIEAKRFPPNASPPNHRWPENLRAAFLLGKIRAYLSGSLTEWLGRSQSVVCKVITEKVAFLLLHLSYDGRYGEQNYSGEKSQQSNQNERE